MLKAVADTLFRPAIPLNEDNLIQVDLPALTASEIREAQLVNSTFDNPNSDNVDFTRSIEGLPNNQWYLL